MPRVDAHHHVWDLSVRPQAWLDGEPFAPIRRTFGVADLEKALDLQKTGPQRSYYVRTYISLGDGYWKTDDLKKAVQAEHSDR